MWKIIYLYVFSFAFLNCFFLSEFFRRFALRFNCTDKPDENRKIHRVPVPLLGGAAMFIAFILTILINFMILRMHRQNLPQLLDLYVPGIYSSGVKIAAILLSSLAIVLTGIIDDLRKLSWRIKLGVQTAAALLVFAAGIRLSLFPGNYALSLLFTVGWIVILTNAFNLMDNMDGLSCGIALISSAIFFTVAAEGGQYLVATILACFCGVLAGFIPYNFHPARMFMGDAGSMFIGYTLAILTIMNTYYHGNRMPTYTPVLMPVLINAVPLFDTFSVIWIRRKNGLSIFSADNNHLSHRLLKLGMTQRQAVLLIYLITFCIGLGALQLRFLDLTNCMFILLQGGCILLIVVLLERVKI